MLGLFSGPAPRVRTVPASAPFLDTLADALVSVLPKDDPFALADTIVFLPNRRASGGLVEALARRTGGAALLPSIRPLGDLDDDPEIWGPDPIALDVGPAIAPLQRRFEIARLVRAYDAATDGPGDPVRALAMAEELCALLDAAALAGGADWDKLDRIAEERDLAAHWKRSAKFLEIVTAHWPARLAEAGLFDPGRRKALLLERLAGLWTKEPTQRRVVIAGSTGALAPTRRLMRAVAALPNGVVVLPGLDVALDEGAWEAIDAQHPQAALKETLHALGVERAAVRALGGEEPRPKRSALLAEALAPADATADWRQRLETRGGAAFFLEAAEGLTLIEAETEDEEARVVALLLRKALESEGRTAALVTPDLNLARRVESKLKRWGVTPSSSIGTRLNDTPHGVFLTLLADLALDDGAPIPLLALLKHPLAALGLTDRARLAAVAALERRVVRGPRRWDDLAALMTLSAKQERDEGRAMAGAYALLDSLRDGLKPLRVVAANEARTLADCADALAAAAELVAAAPHASGASRLWSERAGALAAETLREAGGHGDALGPLALSDLPRALWILLSAREVPPEGGDSRIAIWGPLEARLQQRDLMILGGLNEGVWPQAPRQDPFLSRAMRAGLGLAPPEQRVGLSAHDFAQLAGAPEVVMTRAKRRGGAPAVASRWVWRLSTLARAAGEEDVLAPDAAHDPRRWARALDAPTARIQLRAPEPRPPTSARLSKLSFSRVETLVRDPYALYAREILKLEALKAPGIEAGPAERGTAIHNAIERFGDGEDPASLLAELERALREAGLSIERVRAERVRLQRAAEAFVAWSAPRRRAGYRAFREVRGALGLQHGVELYGRADLIDIRPDGLADIVDYKTGAPPTAREVESGLSPQLTLEAAALARGAFADAPRARAAALVYWRFGGRDPEAATIALEGGADLAAEEALAKLEGLLARYGAETMPFLSKPRAQFAQKYADYDHLARRAEWADAEDEE